MGKYINTGEESSKISNVDLKERSNLWYENSIIVKGFRLVWSKIFLEHKGSSFFFFFRVWELFVFHVLFLRIDSGIGIHSLSFGVYKYV